MDKSDLDIANIQNNYLVLEYRIEKPDNGHYQTSGSLFHDENVCQELKMYQALRRSLDELLRVSDDDWMTFSSILLPVSVGKNEFILREGQICQGVYFLEEGIIRTFLLKEEKEINKAFYFPKEFLREIESYSTNEPSSNFIQAIENSKLVFIQKDKLVKLYNQSIFFQELGRKILEQIAITEQNYTTLLTSYLPKERYLHILNTRPELISRVPLQFLASYLGISRESLSRIRKRVS